MSSTAPRGKPRPDELDLDEHQQIARDALEARGLLLKCLRAIRSRRRLAGPRRQLEASLATLDRARVNLEDRYLELADRGEGGTIYFPVRATR